MMDCFNHLCPFRQNTTSSCNNCECLSCQIRCDGTFAYSADCYILTALWGNPMTKRCISNDELILLPEEEQPSFEEELLKLFGGE